MNDTIRSRGTAVGQGYSNYDYGRRLRRTYHTTAADKYVVTRIATTNEVGGPAGGAPADRVVNLK